MADYYFKGRGSQIKSGNKFLKAQYVTDHIEGLDEPLLENPKTQIFHETPKNILNRVDSPDLSFGFSMNPYQGCEHGCIYCYARNTHEYYGFSAGLDFESKIIVKKNAAQLLEQELLKPNWNAVPIMLSGNTDCYQPQEKKFEITRSMLKVLAQYRHPVSIISKNSLVLRDLDILQDLAVDNLVHVYISITTLDEELRRTLEPRTVSGLKRLKTVKALASANIPVGIMNAPIIPGLNHHEIPAILKAASEHGALNAGMTIVRLNGSIGVLFEDWLRKNFPDRFEKVWNQICSLHDGNVNDSQFGRRMRGEGHIADAIHQLFHSSKKKYFTGKSMPVYDLTKFRKGGMLSLF
ncbi:MAG: PA0069 family radical SAM protein [Cytophagales bacterium]|jgi:DNA repair photolyase|nr:PA0069 family radical SAM protein [Cytophagales bacterium]MCA6386401.1 PA0069 family radical SAM protein [Cytophagales bacterium]MCA6390428.1 PA0069 family radical SAM protein [Cytophagales bacterium]MCA6395006.1 PA0069 family radical SAM protein [Cytophagales bacterium]MCA6397916.1 PA0069 family radical SAM protein [Cytophagales bacterium]